MDRDGVSVACVLCRGMIYFKAGDRETFQSPLHHHHQAYFGLDLLLAVSFITEGERRALVKSIAGQNKRVDKTDATNVLTGSETRDTSTASDFSFEDNEKIYGVPEPVLNCSQCPRTFINIFSLRRHENLHTERNYSCESCGQRFSFLEDLRLHRDIHNSRVDDDEFKKTNFEIVYSRYPPGNNY